MVAGPQRPRHVHLSLCVTHLAASLTHANNTARIVISPLLWPSVNPPTQPPFSNHNRGLLLCHLFIFKSATIQIDQCYFKMLIQKKNRFRSQWFHDRCSIANRYSFDIEPVTMKSFSSRILTWKYPNPESFTFIIVHRLHPLIHKNKIRFVWKRNNLERILLELVW